VLVFGLFFSADCLVCASELRLLYSRRTDIPSLREHYPQAKEDEDGCCCDPAVCGVRCRLVQVVLVHLFPCRQYACSSVISDCLACRAISPSCSPCRLTLWNLVVCALTAAKGVSGSGASMLAVACYSMRCLLVFVVVCSRWAMLVNGVQRWRIAVGQAAVVIVKQSRRS